MSYNFDEIIPREGTDCFKWDSIESTFGADDVIPMWVADGDIACPDSIRDALLMRVSHPVYGYTFAPDSLYEAIMQKAERDYGWKIKKEWILFTYGVVNGLYTAVAAYAKPGEGILIQTPVYHPFYHAIEDAGCHVVKNPMSAKDGYYSIDFGDMEEKLKQGAKMLILCNPHNPVGRAWSKDDLLKIGELCSRYNCLVLSDEIHCDLVFKPHAHIPFASLSKDFEKNALTFWAASKTYNVAGLATSIAIIPDKKLREKFKSAQVDHTGGTMFGFIATEEAYRNCEDYRLEMLNYIEENINYFIDYVNSNIPKLKVCKPEGTYLLWVDMRALGMNQKELNDFIVKKCKLGLNSGDMFGEEGIGFQRFNLSCPRSTVEEALIRLRKAIDAL